MIKLNNMSKSLLAIPVILTLVVMYISYNDKAPENAPTSDINDVYEKYNKEDISEINSLILLVKNSVDKMNEDIFKNKIANDERMKKIELSIEEMSEDKNADARMAVEESLLSPLEESQQRQEQAYNQMSTFNNALAVEDRDDNWATGMEETMLLASQNENYNGSTFYSPSCKSTFCKLEVIHQNNESRDNFESIRREIPNSYHIQHYEEAGELRSVLYIIKQGEESSNIIFNTLNEET